jgi:hypothetical protein
MQECTQFRLDMRNNGYWAVLNDCKRPIEKGWPKKIVTEAVIRAWDRSMLTSTGMKIDGDLAVFDIDVSEADLVEKLAGELGESFPELFTRGFVRHAGGVKEAWIVRVDRPFKRRASRRWYRPGSDPDDPEVAKHMVECFGSLGTGQFGIDGPHARNKHGEVISVYRFAGGASPANTPRGLLPVLPRAAFEQACDHFDKIAAAAGLMAVKELRGGYGSVLRCFELDADTEVETQDYGPMTVAELERFMRARRAGANDAATLRCSGSFHDPVRVRTDSHLINWGRYGLGIFDCMTETTWHRRSRAPSARFELFLKERNPFQ